jgi:hypothetical protein
MAVLDTGSSTAGKANVDASYNLQVVTPGVDGTGTAKGGGHANAGTVNVMFESDSGAKTGVRDIRSPEADRDGRLRIVHDNLIDEEFFNYVAMASSKFFYNATTMTFSQSAAGVLTNAGAVTTTTIGGTFGTIAEFPVGGSQTLVCSTSIAFSAQPNANTLIDFGFIRRGAANPWTPLDGAFFRLSSSGLAAVLSNGGSETTVALPLSGGTGVYAYTNNVVQRYEIRLTEAGASFWINGVKYASIDTQTGNNQPIKGSTIPWGIRHAIVGGAAGAVIQALVSDYKVYLRGAPYADSLGTVGNRVFGSYQALSGQTPGQLAFYANSANPTAAVPTNTTAALGTGLGGQFWETFTLAVNTDGIICSYQVPAGTIASPGRRLKITGVKLSSYIQTVLAGGPANTQYAIAFGHTAVSLATAESAAFTANGGKAPRRIPLPEFTQTLTAAQAVSTAVSQPGGTIATFANPIYVNPGEFVAIVAKHVGTVGTSGTIAHVIAFDYSWE